MTRKASVTFWAGIISVTIHLTVLLISAIFSLSPAKAEEKQSSAPITKIHQIKKLLQATPTVPKPKIKAQTYDGFKSEENRILSSNKIYRPIKTEKIHTADLTKVFTSKDGFSSLNDFNFDIEANFFNSRTNRRRICYVVDCSGSMQGMFGWVREQLKKSIESLEQDQYFCIILFGKDQISKFGNGSLLRASSKNKSEATKFIDSVHPIGKADALLALREAIRLQNANSSNALLIYLLTDGFELAIEESSQVELEITDLLNTFAPSVQINTIGFWPQEEDRKILETIAEKSGGEFVLITDEYKLNKADN